MATLGRYTLLRRVAMGGMAEIWKAKVQGPAGFSKTVAIKKVLPHLVEDEAFIEMFIEEAKLVAELVHPNIVQVFDFGELAPREYFLAMEYVSGANLARLDKRVRDRGGKMPAGVVLYIIAEAAKGLGAAHAKTDPEGKPLEIVHRDVSPQNILVSFGGEVKVSDFGIAKAASASSRTAEGQVRGKLAYMSPEQANVKPLDGRSDLFSLGIILYELLSGQRLFNAPSATEIYGRVSQFAGLTPAELALLPPAIHPIMNQVLAPDPAKQYSSALKLESALTSLLGAEGALRARQNLASMIQSVCDEERRLEQTPTEAVSPEAAAAAGIDSGSVVGSVNPHGETMVTPRTPLPVSGLTLNPPSRVSVVPPATVAPANPPDTRLSGATPRSSKMLFGAMGVAGLFVAISIALSAKMIFGGKGPIAAASPTPAISSVAMASPIVSSTPIATASQAATAAAIASASAAATHAAPTPTRVAIAATPVPVHTAAPTPQPARGQGSLAVKARPWVQVWLDGKMIAKETPLRDFKLGAGSHQLRFVNDSLGFNVTKNVTVQQNAELVVVIDVAKNQIQIGP